MRFVREGAEAVLEVADDGHGFDPSGTSGEGRGLVNLRARAAALDGILEIESVAGGGTMVRIRVPI